MTERAESAEPPPGRPRPRPEPVASSGGRGSRLPSLRGGGGRQVARTAPPQAGNVLAATGGAIVAAAKVGRILGRSGWRIARQLPGVNVVEQQAQRMRQLAAAELTRLLDMPQGMLGSLSLEEQRAMFLVHNADADTQPLRSAMSELLDRSGEANREQSQDYLFGSIVSQLVPDEARILAALATGKPYAALDVLARPGGRSGSQQVVLGNASTVGAAAGVALPANTATYLTRLQGFGLLDFERKADGLDAQFDALLADRMVVTAKAEADRLGNARTVRKVVSLSPLGREFWAACAPSQPPPGGPRGRRSS